MTLWALVLLVSACDPSPSLDGKRLFEEGKFAEAEVRFRRALEQHCDTAQIVTNSINLAATLRERNQLGEARAALESVANTAANEAAYWNCLALVEEQSARPAQAEAAYRRALSLLTSTTPPKLVQQVWTNFARHYMRIGHLLEAESAMNNARRQPGWQHERPSAFDLNEAELRRMQGRPREAEAILHALQQSGRPMPAQLRGAIANNLASLAAQRGAHRQAELLWQQANQALRAAYGPRHPLVGRGLNNLAAHYVERKRYAEAEHLYREALSMYEEPMLINNLAALLHKRGQLTEAESLYRRALALQARPSRDAIQLHGNLAVLLAATRRTEESLAEFQAVVNLLPLAVPADEPTAARFLEGYERLLRARREAAEAERVAALAMRFRVRTALRAEN